MSFFPFFPNEALNHSGLGALTWAFPHFMTLTHSLQKLGQIESPDHNGPYTQNRQLHPHEPKEDPRPEQSIIWTPEQDKLLFQSHEQLGCKWSQIILRLPGKSFNDIKNHFYSLLRKGLRRINGILKQHKIKYKYRAIRERFLLKLSEAMEEKFNKKLGLSQTIICQSYSIRNWLLSMSDNNPQSGQNIDSFKKSFHEFLDFDFSFRKHKPVKSRDNGNLRKYYNKINQSSGDHKNKGEGERSQGMEESRVGYRKVGGREWETKRVGVVMRILDEMEGQCEEGDSQNVKMDASPFISKCEQSGGIREEESPLWNKTVRTSTPVPQTPKLNLIL